MTNITDMFGGAFIPPGQKHVDPPELQLADAMRSAGIDPPHKLEIDGQLHRFSTKGRKRDDSGWYVIFPDEPVAGRFGCWRDQIDCVFKADVGRELTASENMAIIRRQTEAKEERERAREKKASLAANTVDTIWSEAIGASPDHPYLKRKGIEPHGARLTGDGRLIVPLYSSDGELASLQYISEDEKRYHPGGTTKSCSWTLGEVTPGPIFVAEGYATAATVHEISGRPCVISYSANNLPTIVGQLREAHGQTQELVIVADNDASGVGRNKADEASAKHGGRIVMPPSEGDANDYLAGGGDLHDLLFPQITNWSVDGDEFMSQPSPINWQIKHWIQKNALIMVHGPSGGGKTFLVLDMVLAVASGCPEWMGHKVTPGGVFYLAGEGHHGLRGRVAAWAQNHGINTFGGNLRISRSGCDLNTPTGHQKLAEEIRSLPKPPKIIVVDTVNRNFYGDENSAQDTKTMLDSVATLQADFDCSVILVHHTGVNSEAQHRARGSSAWRGALDIEISVVPGDTIEIVQRKSKDAEEAATIFAELQSVPITGWLDEDGEQVTSAVLVAGVEPVKAKKDSPLAKQQKTFENAWWDSGAEDIDGVPYLSRSALIQKLEDDGMAERTIKNMTNPSYENKLIGALIIANMIAKNSGGWTIIDAVWSSAMMVNRGDK